ncbi:hypothetical protein EXT68_03790 [Pectobacterium parmentieri]|uniref:Uncharacterized protein n=2 Tax=Pectobacterium parmentieri TaxID=1905730 RepID=A0A0H3I2N2_PECPM|nr:hypothetical protein [Pectobacterium parmentieri]AFI89935.1 Hypothetical protein W5S_1844 [Pectobacterium parmentieri]MBI0469338.1 hypothetical protein [Pectobacterium parmentieri]MBI0491962.1 hypothetical protein [Pectobacterium parmentieri]MBI0557430.1 hypothetical protein [Pectobacterium parmentieri]MBI0566357.1 hypothetical protein [Pectobacterium parmentieri]
MKKLKVAYSLPLDPNADYKMAWLHERDKRNFESLNKWLYLGADIKDDGFAKVGLTMDDLVSRSYSSANPNYYLFCAFKCRDNITKTEIKNIELGAVEYLELEFSNEDGTSNRARHAESGHLSECFYNINFTNFFISYHDYLYEKHHRDFLVTEFKNEFGDDEGNFLDCEFNPRFTLQEKNKFIRMLLRW